MARTSANITVMVRAAQKAGRGLLRDFNEVEKLQVSMKGPGEFVTVADTRAERAIRDELARARPGYGFLMEESGASGGETPFRWIVDPLDGTTNFLHGLPHFAVAIALEREREVIAGVIHDPVKDETFWAEKGEGAFLNDQRLRVSARRRLPEAVIATGIPFQGRGEHSAYLGQLAAVMAHTAGVRRFGSAALDLAYVAAGRFDGFWEQWLSPWDIAAGILLVREAGGFVSEIDGRQEMLRTGSVLAANQHLHAALGKLVRGD